jgi:PAS domain S-box-containing protein
LHDSSSLSYVPSIGLIPRIDFLHFLVYRSVCCELSDVTVRTHITAIALKRDGKLMTLRKNSYTPIRMRFFKVSLVVFLLIVGLLVVAVSIIPERVDNIVEEELFQPLQKLRYSSEFKLLNERLHLQQKAFIEDSRYLELERMKLKLMLSERDGEVEDRDLDELMASYSRVLYELGRKMKELSIVSDGLLQGTMYFDAQNETIATEARERVRKVIQNTLLSVLGLLAVVTFVSLIFYRNLFNRYFQRPIKKLTTRLESIGLGDRTTPLDLATPGEWQEVEIGFNLLQSSLQQKVDALSESETRYREIFNNVTEAIFRIDLDRAVLELNPMAVTLLGYTSREDALASIDDIRQQLFLNPDVFDTVINRLLDEGLIIDQETQIKRKDGSLLWVVINAHLVWDEQGSPIYFEGTARDIESDKLAQDELQKMQTYLQNIIDAMPSVLIAVDADMRVTLWNEAAARETSVAADAALGMPLDEVFHLFHLLGFLPEGETLHGQGPIQLQKVEADWSAEGGSKRYFDIVIYPLTTKGFMGSVINIDDISERVKLESMMVRSERMQSVGSLASGLAHEINNPLAVILQNSQVLSRRFSPDLAKNREAALELGTDIETVSQYLDERGCRKILQSITSAGHRAAKIVENIQSFSRRDMTSFTPSNLEMLLEQTIELAASDFDMRKKYNFQKIRIVREYSKVETIVCEPSQIQQVILTLLKNAAQAMSHDTENPLLTLRIFPTADNHACLQIEDNGEGMEVEVSKRVFDPFYTTRDTGSGPGLGLSIAYFIVTQNHNGYLGVRSEPGQGTCFDMLLPFDNANVAKAMSAQNSGAESA